MCGIIGSLNLTNTSAEFQYLDEVTKLLRHRGPDSQGAWHDKNVFLSHTRLSILDLSPLGHQPMSYQDQRFWITFNGEIYNYLELREQLITLGHSFRSQSDTEVLLAAYAQWGEHCLDKFRGMFAFAIWDSQRETLFLARDRIGEKPLYYWHDERTFYFASEIKALLPLLPTRQSLDPIAIDLFIHYQYIPEPKTPLQNVHKLPAGYYLLIDKTGSIIPKQYWCLENIPPVTGNPVKLIRQELEQVINLTLRSDVPVGVALSGGIDSGAITALAAPKYKNTLQCFSIGYPNRPPYDERREAEVLAKSLGLPFFDVELTTNGFVDFFPELVAAMDDPIADIAAYGHYSVMQAAREQGIKVMLSGIGGDEVFWGYPWTLDAIAKSQTKLAILQNHKFQPSFLDDLLPRLTNTSIYKKFSQSHKIPLGIRQILQQVISHSQLDLTHPEQAVYQNLVPDFQSALSYQGSFYHAEFLDRIPSRNAFKPFMISWQNIEAIPQQISQIMFDTWLVSNCLALGDRVSMAVSVETRLPFLDYKLIELVVGLRQSYPDHKLGLKYWLKAALQGILPEELLNRPKRGFQPPVNEWMTAVLERYGKWLIDGYLIEAKVLHAANIRKLYQQFIQSGTHIFILYKWLLLETWYRQVLLRQDD